MMGMTNSLNKSTNKLMKQKWVCYLNIEEALEKGGRAGHVQEVHRGPGLLQRGPPAVLRGGASYYW